MKAALAASALLAAGAVVTVLVLTCAAIIDVTVTVLEIGAAAWLQP